MQKTKGRPRTAAASAFRQALEAAGLSEDQAQRWQQLAGVPDEDFEGALAGPDKPSRGKIVAESKPTGEPMDADSLWLWGRLRDFENKGILPRSFDEVLGFMTDAMRSDAERLGGALYPCGTEIRPSAVSKRTILRASERRPLLMFQIATSASFRFRAAGSG